MSQWTHIVGMIRIDAMGNHGGVDPIIRKCFGNTCQYNDTSKVWDECNVPCGSEGSLQYDVVYFGYKETKGNIHSSSISWGAVQIWGDLRNYDDHEEIYQWVLKVVKKLEKHHLYVRDMAIKIHVEYQSDYFITIRDTDDLVDKIIKICISKEVEEVSTLSHQLSEGIDKSKRTNLRPKTQKQSIKPPRQKSK